MIQIGLFNYYKEKSPFSILQKKVGIFAYLNSILYSKTASLFPKSRGLFDFGFKRTLATPCAADDLDLFNTYATEQVEFSDLKNPDSQFLNSNLNYYNYSGDNGVATAHQSYGMAPQNAQNSHAIYHQQGSSQSHSQQILRHISQSGHQNVPFSTLRENLSDEHIQHSLPIPVSSANQQFIQHQGQHLQNFNSNVQYLELSQPEAMTHFDLNMNQADLIDDQYFNDFKPLEPASVDTKDSAEYQSLYGSSSESYVSPLDDEFFKKLSPQGTDNLSGSISNISSTFDAGVGATETIGFDNHTSSSKKRRFDTSPSPNVNFYDVNTIFNDYLIETSKNDDNKLNTKPQQKKSTPVKQENSPSMYQVSKQHSYYEQQQDHQLNLQSNIDDSPINHRHSSIMSTTSSVSVPTPVTSSTTSLPSSKKIKVEADSESMYKCHYCDAKFKVKGYLTRHLKKHNSSKAFICPFYQESPSKHCNPSKKNVTAGTKCHPTGGFSRRDTYKTHLKALHFIYPPGTKSSERNSIGGNCAGCFAFFDNNLRWLEDHIEKGLCTKIVSPHQH